MLCTSSLFSKCVYCLERGGLHLICQSVSWAFCFVAAVLWLDLFLWDFYALFQHVFLCLSQWGFFCACLLCVSDCRSSSRPSSARSRRSSLSNPITVTPGSTKASKIQEPSGLQVTSLCSYDHVRAASNDYLHYLIMSYLLMIKCQHKSVFESFFDSQITPFFKDIYMEPIFISELIFYSPIWKIFLY